MYEVDSIVAYIRKQYETNPKRTIALGIFSVMVLGAAISAIIG